MSSRKLDTVGEYCGETFAILTSVLYLSVFIQYTQ